MEEKECFGGDEESMIPKGLLDVSLEKSYEPNADSPKSTADIQNQNTVHYNLPCYIAFLQPEQSGNMMDRYQYNSTQSNEMHIFPSIPQPIIYPYNVSQAGDYFQYQRNTRTFNVIQQPRLYQDVENPWWNYIGSNQAFFSSPFGNEIRSTNNSRSNNTSMADRIFIPLTPLTPPKYSFEYQQRFSSLDTSNFSNSETIQNSYNKTFQKIWKIDMESQTDEILITSSIMGAFNSENELKYNTEESSTLTENEFFNDFKISAVYHDENCQKNYENNDIAKQSFQNIAYNGCLEIEKLLNNANSTISDGINLTKFCNSLKIDLMKANTSVTSSIAVREMVFAFLQICYSWMSLNAIKTFKHNKIHLQGHVEKLKNCINLWEINSKVLLECITTTLETIPLNEQQPTETPVVKILKNNLNRAKNSELSTMLSKKRYNDTEGNCLNYNWRTSTHSIIKQLEKNENLECATCQLTPENQRSFSESNFICDNFMKNLKNNQEKNLNKIANSQRYPSHKSKSSISPRGRFTIASLQNSSKDSYPRNDSGEKINTDSQKRPKAYSMSENNNYLLNTDFFNFSKMSYASKNLEENRNSLISDKSKEKLTNLENSKSIEGERNKYTIPLNVISAIKKELEAEGERTENKTFYEKGKGKRYSQQCKKKNSYINNFNLFNDQCDSFQKEDNTVEINSSIKLKLYEILVGIQTTDMTKMFGDKLDVVEESKLQRSLIDPVSTIAQSLVRNNFKTVDEIVGTLLSKFYQAKYDNMGNIPLLTMANQLEIKIMNKIYSEIGTYHE